MALKELILRKELAALEQDMNALSAKDAEFQARSDELEAAIHEAATDDDMNAARELVEAFETERTAHESKVNELREQISAKSAELHALETNAPPVNRAAGSPAAPANRSAAILSQEANPMPATLRALAHLSPERRDAFLAREDVNDFADRFREMFRGVAGQHSRAVSGAELLIPDVVLSVLHENIEQYSKLMSRVRTMSLTGTARQTIMGEIPEAVWTEATGAVNELYFGMNQLETDGFMVGGYVPVNNAILEDTNPSLVNEIILGMGRAIGKAIDKAILFGTGSKMPLGFVARLAQSAKPSDYPDKARDWEDLRTSNIITIPSSATGLSLFQQLVIAAGSAKGRYSNGDRFWVMTDATYTRLVSEAMSINAAGAIATGMTRTMPIIGGEIITMGDGGDVIADNAIYGGYGDEYLLIQRAGTNVGYSDIPFYLQNQTVFKATARYDGKPVIAEGFIAIGLGSAPATTAAFPPDIVNVPDPALRALMIGGLSLTPAFAAATASYTAATANAADVVSFITATGATAKLTVNGKTVTPGAPVTWADGENAVKIVVTSHGESKTYTVTVTKS